MINEKNITYCPQCKHYDGRSLRGECTKNARMSPATGKIDHNTTEDCTEKNKGHCPDFKKKWALDQWI